VAVLASRVLGVIRESIFAHLFSVGYVSDAYVLAFRIPNLLRDLFAEGALSSAFVPTFSDALANGGKERAYRLGNLVLTGILLVTGALTLLGIFFAPYVVDLFAGDLEASAAPGRALTDPALVAARDGLASALAAIMMPILTLVSLSAVWMGMLNAQRRFFVPAFAPALFNVTSIVSALGIVAFGLDERRAILVWSVATTAAGVVQAVCQLPALRRLGYRPALALRGFAQDPGVRRIVRLMGPAVLGLAAVQVNVFVNTYFATKLGTGPLSLLNYAFRLFYLPIGIFGVALATVTTSRVSEEAARGDAGALVRRTGEGARAVWLLASASAVGLVVLARPIVQFLFESGRFGPGDTEALVPVVRAYMLGVLPYSLVKVFAPSFYSLDRPRVPMVASLLGVAANLTFNALTYRRLGAEGLALGTTVAALVNLTVLRLAFARRLGPVAAPAARVKQIGALAVANALLAGVAWCGWRACAALLGAAQVDGAPGKLLHGVLLFAVIGIAFVVYAATMSRLRYPGAAELVGLPGKLRERLRGRR
jgi:putative peptidoglycan lipid II flippase